MTRTRNLGLAVLLCAAAAACGDDTGTQATAAGPSLAGGAPLCVKFTPPPPGTIWGSPVGHVPGQLVHTENAIDVLVQPFHWLGGGGSFNYAEIDLPPVAFGSGQVALTNNINLQFYFGNITWIPTKVYFDYLDLGGHENLSVNGSAFYIGDIAAAPPVLGGRNVNVTSFPVFGGTTGRVTIWGGSIKHITTGGQEYYIDNVCAVP
ncbi:MAG TPA: hypothetical protein VE871_18340 [Longimicrobium sp.]|nr:hypothetical protein [Longimicrobium sp.]